MKDQETIHAKSLSEDPKGRVKALKQLEFKFSSLSDKQLAWNYLHKLTNNKDSEVRYSAAYALCSASSHFPDNHLIGELKCLLIIGIFHIG